MGINFSHNCTILCYRGPARPGLRPALRSSGPPGHSLVCPMANPPLAASSNSNEGVNENEEYCCMMRSRLQDHSLVFGAEVDGADPALYKAPHADLKAFVELKTGKEVTSEREQRTLHRFKMIKWWSQSYLVGIPRVVCGFRDNSGTVHSLRTYEVREMPKLAQTQLLSDSTAAKRLISRVCRYTWNNTLGDAHRITSDYWNSDTMLNFLRYFLDFVKINVEIDDPQCVYRFERLAGGDITCTYLGRDPEWTFLPDWYYKKVKPHLAADLTLVTQIPPAPCFRDEDSPVTSQPPQ
ncbi:Decapping and exoribonuclease protein [Chionoecetes opilio]|uniref:Decapping nuclease n=1 Tax=Chionoecetes opilio TaxID=41210 RepID=A0A8J4XVD1_CHIOP|nr:Decapping and exoribonuclease protein [Chionoecetes opilio]